MYRWVWDHHGWWGHWAVTGGAKEGELLACLGALYPQRHPFFRHINWDDLLARRVDPPFRPYLVSGGPTGLVVRGGLCLGRPLTPPHSGLPTAVRGGREPV